VGRTRWHWALSCFIRSSAIWPSLAGIRVAVFLALGRSSTSLETLCCSCCCCSDAVDLLLPVALRCRPHQKQRGLLSYCCTCCQCCAVCCCYCCCASAVVRRSVSTLTTPSKPLDFTQHPGEPVFILVCYCWCCCSAVVRRSVSTPTTPPEALRVYSAPRRGRFHPWRLVAPSAKP
jgi:hypothetical protein